MSTVFVGGSNREKQEKVASPRVCIYSTYMHVSVYRLFLYWTFSLGTRDVVVVVVVVVVVSIRDYAEVCGGDADTHADCEIAGRAKKKRATKAGNFTPVDM